MKITATEIVMSKEELGEWVQCLTSFWRDELEVHGIGTDSCYLDAAWKSLEKMGVIKYDKENGTFELIPDQVEKEHTMKDSTSIKMGDR